MHTHRKLCFLLSPPANTKARSNDFAEKNGLRKYEYVLHPRTTGFTFVVECLREGNPALHFYIRFCLERTYSPQNGGSQSSQSLKCFQRCFTNTGYQKGLACCYT